MAKKHTTNHPPANAREAALLSLQAWRTQGAWSDLTFKTTLTQLPPRERALATQLGYGVITHVLTLDECIKRASSIGLSRVEPMVRDILRLGVYQLHYLDKIPPSAAVDETVKLAHKFASKRAIPFVNAVMRTVSAWDALPKLSTLWLRTSHPEWLMETLIQQEGYARTEALFEYNNEIPPLYLNLAPDCPPQTYERATPFPLLSDCLLLERSGDVEDLPGFAAGQFLVADPAARMAVLAAGPQPGETILDACAAPGGKTILMSWATKGAIKLVSQDLYTHRVAALQETLAKYGVDGVKCVVGSAARFDQNYQEAFDMVLADVPCSGFGIIRKKPDIRYKTKEDVEALPAIQKLIIDNLAAYVKPGGRLIYVTCTVLRAENQEVIQSFLENHSEFSLEPFTLPIGEAPTGEFAIWPPEHQMDGFYMARLRKRGAL